MKKFNLIMAVVFIGALVLVTCARAQNIQEGKWTMTMVTTVEGMDAEFEEAMAEMENMSAEEKAMMQQMMGGMNIQMDVNSQGITTTITQCLSDQDPVPDMNKKGNEDCQVTHTTNGDTVNFTVICKDSESTGKITYKGDTMDGVIKAHQTAVDGEETDVTIKINGQYLGPCS